jgi:hypothetical protein
MMWTGKTKKMDFPCLDRQFDATDRHGEVPFVGGPLSKGESF